MHDSPTESAPLCGSPAALAPSPRPARPKPTDRGGLGVLPVRGAVPSLDGEGFSQDFVFWFLFVPKSGKKAGGTIQIESVLSLFFLKPKITSPLPHLEFLQVCGHLTGFWTAFIFELRIYGFSAFLRVSGMALEMTEIDSSKDLRAEMAVKRAAKPVKSCQTRKVRSKRWFKAGRIP